MSSKEIPAVSNGESGESLFDTVNQEYFESYQDYDVILITITFIVSKLNNKFFNYLFHLFVVI